MNITLSEDKENINPNIMTSNHFDSYSLNKTKQPKISRFKAFDKDWRKKIMYPSSKEVQIQQKLTNMLNFQQCYNQLLPTAQSEERLGASFRSTANLTLQKYYQQRGRNHAKIGIKDELIEIAQLLRNLTFKDAQKLQNLSQQQLALMIKKNLRMLIQRGNGQI